MAAKKDVCAQVLKNRSSHKPAPSVCPLPRSTLRIAVPWHFGCYGDFSPVTSLGVQFSSDSLLDNPSGSAHCALVRRNALTRVIRRKPILPEQALPVLPRSPRSRPCPILVDAEGDRHADSQTIED